MGVRWGVVPSMRQNRILNPAWLLEMAEVLERSGCESVWMPEHVVVAAACTSRYPYNASGRMPLADDTVLPDPLQLLGHLAPLTSRLRLATGVLVLPQHSAAILAKRVASLDVLSRGRVILGVGVGWQAEEYEAVGVPFRDRGLRMDEHIHAMRLLWGPGPNTFHGRFVHFDAVHCDPKPFGPRGVPIVVGGSTSAAARRAGRLGDGYYPIAVGPEEFAALVAEMRVAADDAGRDAAAIEVTAWPGSWLRDRAFDGALAAAYVSAGASRLILRTDEAGADADELERYLQRYQEVVVGTVS